MTANRRTYKGAVPPEVAELLRATRPVEKALADLAAEPLHLDKDPEFVADCLKGDIVEAILVAMKDQDLNRSDLAARLGKSRQWVSRILNESDNFTVETIARLALAVGRKPVITLVAPEERVGQEKQSRRPAVRRQTARQGAATRSARATPRQGRTS